VLAGLEAYAERFDHVIEPAASRAHWDNLNRLGQRVIEEGDPGDAIVFLDGDAFPVARLRPALERMLAEAPLVAVRRDENLGDPMPHPVFCATSVGFWRELGGDWTPDASVRNELGEGLPRDPGGVLLRQLAKEGIEWTPLLRSADLGAHPLFFGVYGGLIYHHGAGFRRTVSRLDMAGAPSRRRWLGLTRALYLARIARRNARLSREVRARIETDPAFFAPNVRTSPV
jgi:hypothetical protein